MALSYNLYAQKYRDLYPDADENEIKEGYQSETAMTVPEALVSGLQSGFHQTLGGFGTLGDMVGLPTKDWAESQYTKAENYALPEHLQGRVWDNPALLKDPRWLAHSFGQVAPSVAASVIPGGLAFKGAQLAKWSPAAARTAAAVTSGMAGGGLEGAGTYRETGSVPQSLAMMGAATALNAVPAYKLFGPLGKSGVGGKFLSMGAAEAATEWAEEPAEALITGQSVTEAMKAGLNVMPGSFLMGGMMGGGSALAQKTKKAPKLEAAPAYYYDAGTGAVIPQTVMEAAEEARSRPQTYKIHTPERTVLRDQIAAQVYGQGASQHNKVVDIVMGPPAAGKSSAVAEPLAKRHGSIIIDSDFAKGMLPEYDKGFGAAALHQESSDITDHVLEQAISNNDNIVLPVIGKTLSGLQERIGLFKQLGYTVNVHYVDLPLKKSVDRAVQRFRETGRLVDPGYILKDVARKPAENYETLRKEGLADDYKAYSNDVEFGQPAQEIAELTGPYSGLGRGDGQGAARYFEKVGEQGESQLSIPIERAYEFYSPNIGEDMPFGEAVKMLRSEQQALARSISEDIDKDITHKTIGAVGDWADGAENSFVTEYSGVDRETLRYLAARKGKQFSQKAVLPFFASEAGEDVLYIMEVNDSIEGARQALVDNGVEYRTIAPITKDRVRIHVVDSGGELFDNMNKVGEHYDTEIDILRGQADWSLGGETRAEGLKQYESAIKDYEQSSVQRQDGGGYRSGQGLHPTGQVGKYNITAEEIEGQINYANRIDEIGEWGVRPPVPLAVPSPVLSKLIDGFDAPYFGESNNFHGAAYHKLEGTEANIVAAALNDIMGAGLSGEALGNIEAVVSFDPKEGEEGNLAYFVVRNGMRKGYNPPYLAISTKGLAALQATNNVTLMKNLRWTLAHELGHALDIGSTAEGESLTSYSDLFDIDPFKFNVVDAPGTFLGGKTSRVTGKAFGPIMDEMIRAFESVEGSVDGFTTMMQYPLIDTGHLSLRGMNVEVSMPFGQDIEMTSSQLRDVMRKVQREGKGTPMERMIAMEMGSSYGNKVMELQQELTRVKAEVFAQMHAMYYITPKLLKKHAPTAFKFVEELSGYGNKGLSAGSFNSAIRKHFQAQTRTAYSDERGAPKWAVAWNGNTGGALLEYAATTRGARRSSEGGAQLPRVRWLSKADNVVGIPPAGPQMEAPAGAPPGPPQGEPDVTKIAREQGGQAATDASRRGVQTWEATTHLANVLGTSPAEVEKFLQRKFGTAFNAEQLHQSAAMVEQEWTESHETFKQLNEKMNQGDLSDTDMAKAYETILSLNSMNAQFMGVRAEAGRALNIFRKLQDTVGLVAAISQETNRKGGREMLKAQIALLAEMDKPGAGMKAARDVMKITKWDKFLEYYTAALVSGLPTHVVNSVSNTAMQLLEDMSRGVASLVGGVLGSKDRITLGELAARMSGYTAGSRMGLQAFWEMTKDEDAQMESMPVTRGLVKAEGRHAHAIGGLLGKGIRIPFRFLGAEDMFFKSLTVGKELAGLAYVESKKTGQPMAEILNNPTQEMLNTANDEASRITFTERAGPLSQMMTHIGTEFPAFRIIAPFIRTPGNLIKQGLKHSLAAPLFASVRNDIRKGGRTRDMAVARMITGTTISATAITLAMQGLLTGSPPEEPNERRMWYQQGFQGNSIKIGDTWVSYSRLEPFGMLLGIAADMHTFSTKIGTDEAGELAALLTSSVMSNLTSKTYLRGVSEVVAAINEPERYGERWLQRLGATIATPTFLSYTAKATDDRLRKAETLMDQIKSRVPGMRTTLPERLDIFGEPIMEQGSGAYRFFSPAYLKKAKHDPVARELMDNEVRFPAIGKKFRGVELDSKQYNSLVEAVGKPAYNVLRRVVSSQNYKNLPPPIKKWMLQKVVDSVRSNARLYWSMKHPEILKEAQRLKREKQFGTT